MTTMTPVFQVPEPHHYSDYGFDPQINYFQVLEEARRHSKRAEPPRPIDSIHFKLQKPISKDDRSKSKKRKWWKSAVDFWKRTRSGSTGHDYPHRAVTGPVYVTESFGGSGSRTPCRRSVPLMAAEVGMEVVPYVCLRSLNVTDGHRISAPGLCRRVGEVYDTFTESELK